MKRSVVLLSLVSLAMPLSALPEADEAAAAQAKGAAWLLKQQQPDGTFSPSPKMPGEVGVTGLALTALARSGQAKAPEVQKGIDYLIKNVHEDGSIYNEDGQGLYNYRTSVALMALSSVDPVKYKDAIRKAQDFITGIQRCEKNDGTPKSNPEYGGIGYGDDGPKNDMSNTQMALQALKESGGLNDEVFQRAAEFASKCQNLQATNPMAKDPKAKVGVGNDGSFYYGPQGDKDVLDKAGMESVDSGQPHPKGYGSMTYAGLLTMVYARLTKEDPRVSAAYGWIQKHYTLEDNPGMATPEKPKAGKQGLYYYYLTFAKAMKAYGETHVQTPDGQKHRWSKELLDTLLKAQKPEGFWTNGDAERWMEGNPVLATAYALECIRICREDLGGSK